MKTILHAAIITTFTIGSLNFNSDLNSPAFRASYKVEVKKSTTYKGNALEAIYIILCTSTSNKNSRQFELIKTDNILKSYFMAEFVLVEKLDQQQINYYPLGWESTKIKVEDLRTDCLSILSNDVKPVDISQ